MKIRKHLIGCQTVGTIIATNCVYFEGDDIFELKQKLLKSVYLNEH